jgi:TPR repeat protein
MVETKSGARHFLGAAVLGLWLSNCGASVPAATGADTLSDEPQPETASCGPSEACQAECDAGNAMSCEWLGRMYETGEGAAQDYDKAASLYDLACEGGRGEACAHLAMMYDIGLAVDEDAGKAAVLYQRACESGNRWACKRRQQLDE